MKEMVIVLTILLVSSISAFARMSNSQGGGMMGGVEWATDRALALDGYLLSLSSSFWVPFI